MRVPKTVVLSVALCPTYESLRIDKVTDQGGTLLVLYLRTIDSIADPQLTPSLRVAVRSNGSSLIIKHGHRTSPFVTPAFIVLQEVVLNQFPIIV